MKEASPVAPPIEIGAHVTPLPILKMVTWALFLFTLIGVIAISVVMIFSIKTEPQVFQAMLQLTVSFGSTFGGMLINTRQPVQNEVGTTTATMTATPESDNSRRVER